MTEHRRRAGQDELETPRVGKDVHFVGLDTDGPCEAAKITRVSNPPAIICGLVVFRWWSEITFEAPVHYDHNRSQRSWHWPHECLAKDEAAASAR